LKRAAEWLADRAGLDTIRKKILEHPVPPSTADRKKAWMYVLGMGTLAAFLLQVVTGIALTTRYIPSAEYAQGSLEFIDERLRGGALVRGMHFFGASAMLILVILHAGRVFLTGSYKFPREAQWLSGVLLLLLTLAMAFTGQLLRWDQNGQWTVEVAAGVVERIPVLGGALAGFLLAGPGVGSATLSRFYAFHILVIPLLILAVIGVHMYLVLLHGVSEAPRKGHPVDPTRYRRWYADHLRREGRPYFPDAAWREAVFATIVMTSVFVLAAAFGPKRPAPPATPGQIPASGRPDWFLDWYYALHGIGSPALQTLAMLYLPLLAAATLLLLPLIAPGGERHAAARPWSIALILGIGATLVGLTWLGWRQPR